MGITLNGILIPIFIYFAWRTACKKQFNLHPTKWYVLHAEANALSKVASSTQSSQGATLYITLSPCKECSKLIHQSGIQRVVYAKAYRDTTGIDFLEKAGVSVVHMPISETE